MARIVAAMAMTHSPGLTGWFTRAPEAHQRLALGATAEMRRRLEAARPDVLVMFTNDHLLNWPINNIPEYPVGIAVIATGGLSHEPGGPRYFWIDEEFDRWFLDLLAKGDHETLLAECTLERMEAAGSGGTAELLSWFLVLAMTRGPADVLAYMPAVAWRSGTGMVAWGELAGD